MSIHSFINGLQVGPAWSHVNLTAHPLIATGNGKTAYLTLDEALTTNRFRIGETLNFGQSTGIEGIQWSVTTSAVARW
jgi:hypothetical protein